MTIATDTPAILFDTEQAAPETCNFLLYGPAGAGKSTAAVSAPGPILYLNLEGRNALAYARKKAREAGTEITSISLAPDDDPREALRECVRILHDGGFGTFVLDTLGKYRDQLARAVGGDAPSLPQWGQIGKSIMDAVRTLRDLPVNVVLICHEEIKDSDEGDRIIRPLIGGRTTEDVCAEVDVIAYCRAVTDEEGTRYVGQLVEARGRRAKDRSGGLGTARDLDLTEWLGAYRAALTADNTDLPWNDDTEETK